MGGKAIGLLDGRIAIVTGAARGLGEGIARSFAEEGALIICADAADASGVALSLPHAGVGKSWAVVLDVTQRSDFERLVNQVVERHGRLDILMNNAGIGQPVGTWLETDDDTIDRVLNVNVRGVINGCRAAGRVMALAVYGKIINTASQAGKSAWPGWGIYSVSKAAVIAITQSLALELAPHHVAVNCICPGTMETNMTREGFGATARQQGRDLNVLLKEKADSIPFGRLGQPAGYRSDGCLDSVRPLFLYDRRRVQSDWR